MQYSEQIHKKDIERTKLLLLIEIIYSHFFLKTFIVTKKLILKMFLFFGVVSVYLLKYL